jgi:hypothetical protein
MDELRSGSTHTAGDLIYDAIFIAGVGGGLVALFFLVLDVVTRGQALFTPSLMGSVLFDRASPQAVQTVSMLAVARYSAVHIAAFSVFGLALSMITHQAEIRSRHPLLVIATVFVALEAAFWAGVTVAIPGVLERIGIGAVATANLLAAVGVGVFLVSTHRPEAWMRVRRAAHLGGAART